MRPTPLFRDRRAAGRILGAALRAHAGHGTAIVLGLPRGGVPVADEVARTLGLPLDVLTVRRLGLPGKPDVAMGALATGGVCVLDWEAIALAGVTPPEVEASKRHEEELLHRRERLLRGDRPPVEVAGSVVIVVDDGMASGATMRAAVVALRRRNALKIIVAVPVGSPEACAALSTIVERCVCLATPVPFVGIGLWYWDFPHVEDGEVHEMLVNANAFLPEVAAAHSRPDLESEPSTL